MCAKLTIKTRQLSRAAIFVINFKHEIGFSILI